LWYLRRYVSVMQWSTLKYVVRATSGPDVAAAAAACCCSAPPPPVVVVDDDDLRPAARSRSRSSPSQDDAVLRSGSEPDLELASEQDFLPVVSDFLLGLVYGVALEADLGGRGSWRRRGLKVGWVWDGVLREAVPDGP
jgi:hypothetical protein